MSAGKCLSCSKRAGGHRGASRPELSIESGLEAKRLGVRPLATGLESAACYNSGMSAHTTTNDSASNSADNVTGRPSSGVAARPEPTPDAGDANPSARISQHLVVDSLPETVITARASAWGWNLRELWRYRELGLLLAWRDVVVHYKQTMLGIAWAILRPSLLTAIFALFLGRVVEKQTDGVPYALFVYAGLLPWTLFATSLGAAANSVIGSERLITKVYFPRVLLPLAAMGPAVVDLFFGIVLLGALLAWFGQPPAWSALLMILPLGVALLCAAALGAMLAALNVVYRDIRHALPFLIQAGMFATPAIYLPSESEVTPAQAVAVVETEQTWEDLNFDESARETVRVVSSSAPPARATALPRPLVLLNPLNACVSFFRAALVGEPLPWFELFLATLWGLVAGVLGALVFHRLEASFADVV